MNTRNPLSLSFKETARLVRKSHLCPFKQSGMIAPDNPQDYRAQLLRFKKQNPKFRKLWDAAEIWAIDEHMSRVAAHATYSAASEEFKKRFPVSWITSPDTREKLYSVLAEFSKRLPVGFGLDNLIYPKRQKGLPYGLQKRPTKRGRSRKIA